jgi:hypothetical protein
MYLTLTNIFTKLIGKTTSRQLFRKIVNENLYRGNFYEDYDDYGDYYDYDDYDEEDFIDFDDYDY